MENLTVEERVGLSLCGLAQLVNQGTAISRDWNQLLNQANLTEQEVTSEQFTRFGQRWESLTSETAKFTALEDASPIHALLFSYFQTMVWAMEMFAEGDILSANQWVTEANRHDSQSTTALQDASASGPGWGARRKYGGTP